MFPMLITFLILSTLYAGVQPDGTELINKVKDGGHSYEQGITFLGWSADGRYYAFETTHPDYGMASCPYGMSLEIVDSFNDKWVQGSGYKLEDSETNDGCTLGSRESLKKQFRSNIKPLLAKWNINLGHLQPSIDLRQTNDSYHFKVDNKEFEFNFTSDNDHEQAWDKGNGYYLKWVRPTTAVIEKGKKRVVYSYNVHSVFISPTKTSVSFIIAKTQPAPEGSETSFMSNGSLLVK